MTDEATPAYGDALRELETILTSLESSTVDVDSLAADVARATELIAYCRARLDVVRTQVTDILDTNHG